jgi:hypothetical protein
MVLLGLAAGVEIWAWAAPANKAKPTEREKTAFIRKVE